MTTVSSSTSSASTSSSASSTNSVAASSASSVYNTFLLLLTTQLKNQDPTNPTDTTAFTQEMIGLASLEQQVNTNTDLAEMQSSLSTLTTTNGVGYLGKTVVATGSTEPLTSAGGTAEWKYTLGSTSATTKLSITNSSGSTVWSGTGDTATGTHTLSWNGTDSSGSTANAGDYTLTVAATDGSGNTVTTTTSIVGTVTGVDTSSGSTVLSLGDVNVALSNVTGFSS